ncbi:MAG TPA: flagellar biosynthetic protein FliO [Terriglobales bacterium]|nr:flagellar biosynthetic protein FliO [Terriglobales bacterium]
MMTETPEKKTGRTTGKHPRPTTRVSTNRAKRSKATRAAESQAGGLLPMVVRNPSGETRTKDLPPACDSESRTLAITEAAESPVPTPRPSPGDTASAASARWWTRFRGYLGRFQAPKKRLRVCESVSLGDKRFLAIVRVDSESFLLGGSTGSVSMLAKLQEPESFSSVLRQKAEVAGLAQ